jgi:hypothetical protein
VSRQQRLLKALLVVAHDLWGWVILAHAVSRFDAFLFLFGQTMTNSAVELWLLRRLGRKIVFIYSGSDARPPYIDGGWFAGEADGPRPDAGSVAALASRCRRRIRRQESFAHYTVNSPATAHFHARRYINWFSMGIPKASPARVPTGTPSGETVRILHAPSNPLVKGSARITGIIEAIRAKGLPVELVTVQGMPNERVLDELARCDFIVDQMYSDTPMAAFATEAALFGKPAVVGGYFAADMGRCLRPEDTPPSLFVEPDALETAVERMVRDAGLRRELGAEARRFVTARWTPLEVAQRYLRLLRDDVPPDWWCDPADVRYVDGCGLPRERVRRLVDLLVTRTGVQALQVSDKPALEAAFRSLASAAPADAWNA